MAFEDWTKDAAGNLTLVPLAAFDIARLANMAIALRLRVERHGDAPGQPTASLQLVLNTVQADALGEALQSAAERIRSQPAPDLKN